MYQNYQNIILLNTVLTLITYARYFLPWQEKRSCLVRLYDGVHECLPVINTTSIINLLVYFSYAHYLWYMLYWQTVNLSLFGLHFTFLIYNRILMLSLCPLLVPEKAQSLTDVTQKLILGDIPFFENDLFFSGHVSCGVMLGLTVGNVSGAYVHYGLTLLQAICMLFSKVHYTIDILVAPYVSYGCFVLAQMALASLQ